MLRGYQGEFDGIFSLRGPSAALRMRSALGYRPGPQLVSEIWCHGRWGRFRSMGRCWWRGRRRVPHCIGAWDARLPKRGSWMDRLDTDACQCVQRLLDSERAQSGVRLARTPEFLAWRYLSHPSRCYALANLGDLCVVAHEFRRAILSLDEVLPGEIVNLDRSEVWRRILQLVLDSGYCAIALQGAIAASRHRRALESCGWSLFRTSTTPGMSETQGPPIWCNPEGPQADRMEPDRWMLGAGASEGP